MAHEAAVQPVFVLGSARSGTTYLGNLLSRHPRVAGVEHRVHWGQVESNAWTVGRFAGDLARDEDLIRFLEVYAACDFFRLAGGDKAAVYRARPRDFYELWFGLMDAHAERRGARYWVTKLDPMLLYRPAALREFLARVDARYGGCRFVALRRDFVAVLRSYLRMEGRGSIWRLGPLKKQAAVLLESARHVVHDRAIAGLVRRRGGVLLDFAQLRDDPAAALKPVCAELGLDYDPHMLAVPHEKNSSIHGTARADPSALSRALALHVYRPVFRLLPGAGALLLRARDATRPAAVPLAFRLLRLEHMPTRLEADLVQSGQLALRRLLFGDSGAP